MSCDNPLKNTYFSNEVNPKTGKYPVLFSPANFAALKPVTIPCGRCTGCRLERSRQWAIRLMHEAQLHTHSCFLTLTYRDENLPEGGSLELKDFQDFMKRLRKKFGPRIRFFHCGEYGPEFQRPHYHAIIYGLNFSDKTEWKTQNGYTIHRSKTLEKLWPHGHSSIGEVTFESAAYVARYIMKKMTGSKAEEHYETLDEYGEYIQLKPEYITMSRRPGIASDWFKKYYRDVFPDDFVVLSRGDKTIKSKPPKYYDKMFDISCQDEFEDIKLSRKQKALKHAENNTPDRLAVKAMVRDLKIKQLKRNYEND